MLKILKFPAVELVAKGGKSKILSSSLDRELALKEFIIGVESYRRDRIRRIDAGDESAQLHFPRAAPAKAGSGAKAGAPGSGKAPAPAGAPKPPAGKQPVPATRPVAKAVEKTPVAPRTAPPGVAAAAGAGIVKRPLPPGAAAAAGAGAAPPTKMEENRGVSSSSARFFSVLLTDSTAPEATMLGGITVGALVSDWSSCTVLLLDAAAIEEAPLLGGTTSGGVKRGWSSCTMLLLDAAAIEEAPLLGGTTSGGVKTGWSSSMGGSKILSSSLAGSDAV